MESKPINPIPSDAKYYEYVAACLPSKDKKIDKPPINNEPEDIISLGDGSISPEEARYFTSGNKVTPLIDGGPIFSSAKDMIKSAKSNIQVEMYSFTNKEMADLLCDEAKRGIKVQVILDPTSGSNSGQSGQNNEIIEQLKSSGVEVVTYPVDEKKKQIDHVKLLIVDGKSVLMGGMNWGEHSPYNHDANLKIEGPEVNKYEKIFTRDWEKSGGKPFTPPPEAKEVAGGKSLVNSAASEIGQTSIKPVIMRNIEKAEKSIHAEMFVLSDSDVINGLIDAHNRGVDVKVLLDPNGVSEGWSPNGKTFKTLKKAGVPVKWYNVDTSTQEKLHAKWATIDGKETIIGSANWSYKGLHINREIATNVVDEEVTSVFEKQFEYDWNNKGVDKLPVIEKPAKEYIKGSPLKAPSNE